MGIEETERLSELIAGAALSEALCSIVELGVAEHIEATVVRVTARHSTSKGRRSSAISACPCASANSPT
jgi:hypothetical protein